MRPNPDASRGLPRIRPRRTVEPTSMQHAGTPTDAPSDAPADAAAIDPAILAEPVSGRHLAAATFGEALGDAPTALVFLRHYG